MSIFFKYEVKAYGLGSADYNRLHNSIDFNPANAVRLTLIEKKMPFCLVSFATPEFMQPINPT